MKFTKNVLFIVLFSTFSTVNGTAYGNDKPCSYYLYPNHKLENETDFKIISGFRSTDIEQRMRSYKSAGMLSNLGAIKSAYEILNTEFIIPTFVLSNIQSPDWIEKTESLMKEYENSRRLLYSILLQSGNTPETLRPSLVMPDFFQKKLNALSFFVNFQDYENIVEWIKKDMPEMISYVCATSKNPDLLNSLINITLQLEEYLMYFNVSDNPGDRSKAPTYIYQLKIHSNFYYETNEGLIEYLKSHNVYESFANLAIARLQSFNSAFQSARALVKEYDRCVLVDEVPPADCKKSDIGKYLVKFAHDMRAQSLSIHLPYSRREIFTGIAEVRLSAELHRYHETLSHILYLNPESYPGVDIMKRAFNNSSGFGIDYALLLSIIGFLDRDIDKIIGTSEFRFLQVLTIFLGRTEIFGVTQNLPEIFYEDIAKELKGIGL